MKKTTLKLTAIVCLAALGTSASAAEEAKENVQKLKLKKVLKGDTVAFEGKECKIAGIYITSPNENPLKFERRSGLAHMTGMYAGLIGRDSQRALAKMLKEGELYSVESVGSNSCVVYDKDGNNIGEKMVAEGRAVPAMKDLSAENRERYEVLLKTAKKARVGFWDRRGGKMYKDIMTFLVSENSVSNN